MCISTSVPRGGGSTRGIDSYGLFRGVLGREKGDEGTGKVGGWTDRKKGELRKGEDGTG